VFVDKSRLRIKPHILKNIASGGVTVEANDLERPPTYWLREVLTVTAIISSFTPTVCLYLY